MKNIFKIAIFGGALLFSGCKENFEPILPGKLLPSNYLTTEAEYQAYALQAYKPFLAKWGYSDVAYQNTFHGYEYGHLIMFDLPTDLFNTFTEWGGFFEFFSKADFKFLKNQGQASHFEKVRYVSRMTQIIGDIENSKLSQGSKDKLIAEVKMGRGWAMYYLLHMYGPVPVIMDPALIGTEAEANLTRPSRETFVKYIEEDLTFAATHLEQTPAEYGRFNKGLALGVLMRLHMNEKKWEAAIEAGRKIQGMGYSLVSDYASLFREATEKNSETIWAVSVSPVATEKEESGSFNAWPRYTFASDYKGKNITGWAAVFRPTWDFYDSFDPADKRRNLMVAEYTNTKGVLIKREDMKGPILVKYPDETGTQMQGNDIPVLRYADVLLMLAEAINNTAGPTAEAVGLVNEVRSVHGGIAELPTEETASQAAFNDAIFRERAFDLYFEGVRKMDLVRHGKWESALQQAGKTPGPALFPVPQYAITVSNGTLTQTEGY